MRAPRRRRAHAVRVLERELAAARRSKSAASCSCSSTRIDREVEELHQNRCACASSATARRSACSCSRAWRRARSSRPANKACKLQVAVSYGGRWDILQAARKLAAAVRQRRAARSKPSTRTRFARELALGGRARSGSVHPHRRRSPHQQFPAVESRLHRAARLRHACGRISTLPHLEAALASFAGRERRFGLTREQLRDKHARGGQRCLSNASSPRWCWSRCCWA